MGPYRRPPPARGSAARPWERARPDGLTGGGRHGLRGAVPEAGIKPSRPGSGKNAGEKPAGTAACMLAWPPLSMRERA